MHSNGAWTALISKTTWRLNHLPTDHYMDMDMNAGKETEPLQPLVCRETKICVPQACPLLNPLCPLITWS